MRNEEARPVGTDDRAGLGGSANNTNQPIGKSTATSGRIDLSTLADAELERYARRWSRVAQQARRDLPSCPPELDDVVTAAATARLILKRRRAAANLAAAAAEVQRLGGDHGD